VSGLKQGASPAAAGTNIHFNNLFIFELCTAGALLSTRILF
jgi:hypothetical protein